MVLIVFLSSRISPFTSTVTFLERSPLATAVVTSAIFLTCPVRLLAILFTLSVKSFQTPPTPRTVACPPNFPSVPTSRATRVTSIENKFSCFTMPFTSLAILKNSPCKGLPSIDKGISCNRFPFATEVITCAISMVGCTRSEMSVLTESTHELQDPLAPSRRTRLVSLPCFPILFPTF